MFDEDVEFDDIIDALNSRLYFFDDVEESSTKKEINLSQNQMNEIDHLLLENLSIK